MTSYSNQPPLHFDTLTATYPTWPDFSPRRAHCTRPATAHGYARLHATHFTSLMFSCTFWLTVKLLNLSNDHQIISNLSGNRRAKKKKPLRARLEPSSHLSEPQNPAASKLAWPWPPHGRYDDSRRGFSGSDRPKIRGFFSKPWWLGHYIWVAARWAEDLMFFTQGHWRLKWLNHGLGLDVHSLSCLKASQNLLVSVRGTVGCRSWGLILAVMPAPLLVMLMAQ